MQKDFIFTSESVSEGHPDKVADQISDAVLDAILAQDKHARVAGETLVNTGLVRAGRRNHHHGGASITTRSRARPSSASATTTPNRHRLQRLRRAGRLRQAVARHRAGRGRRRRASILDQGAGDQGLMFGYACDETAGADAAADLSRAPPGRAPGGAAQATAACRGCARTPSRRSPIRYVDGKPHSHRHRRAVHPASPRSIARSSSTEAVIEEIIKPVLPQEC